MLPLPIFYITFVFNGNIWEHISHNVSVFCRITFREICDKIGTPQLCVG